MLLQCTPQQARNGDHFVDAIRLFYNKASVVEYTYQKLRGLQTPVARINAIHSESAASSANPDDGGGLHPIVFFFATHARIMLTANIWQQVSLCNGAAGTVHQLLYQLIANHHTCPLLYWLTLTTLLVYHSLVVGQTVCRSLH